MRRLLRNARNQANRWRERALWTVRKRRTKRRIEVPDPLPEAGADRDAVLVFTPYAGVGPLFVAACVLARTLQERGQRVLVARCYRLFERCPVMEMLQLPQAATDAAITDVCLRCADNSLSMAETYGLECIDMRQLMTAPLRETVRRAVENAPANLLDFQFEGQPFGKLSAVDLTLAWKISNLEAVSAPMRKAWLQYLASNV